MDNSTRGAVAEYSAMADQEGSVSEREDAEQEEKVFTLYDTGKAMLETGPLNILLVCVPIGMVSYYLRWPDLITFVFSLLGLAPLAERLGFVTEQLAMHTNETIGGLLNATFGNLTELIVAITALNRGLYRLVQLSLLGSVLSNMLLVLGTAFAFGGYYNKTQSFGTISSQMNSTLLLVSTMAVLFPTVLTMSGEESALGQLGLSRATSLILFLLYFAFIYFQLISHKYLYEERPPPDADEKYENGNGSSSSRALQQRQTEVIVEEDGEGYESDYGTGNEETPKNTSVTDGEEDDDDEEEEDLLGFNYALVWLGVMTVLIALLSDAISATIQDAADSANISGIFIAGIVLPIVGNAAEHAGAVMFAVKGKLDLSLGVAIGSSTQIAVCVLPLIVLIGWVLNKDMDLNFGAYEASTMLLSVIAVTFAIKDGHSNWLLGVTLIAAYLVVSVGFYAHKNDNLQ